MNGFQLTFYLEQDRRHGHQPLAEWLVEAVREMGIPGATVIAATQGFGHHGHVHSARFFELGDQPRAVVMVVSAADADRVLARLAAEAIELFYVRVAVEFGITGRAPGAS